MWRLLEKEVAVSGRRVTSFARCLLLFQQPHPPSLLLS
jgi:hypothetical protein